MMRRLLFFLLAMACPFVSVSAQTYEAVYVYLNDGGLNAFLKSDLDSIRFSTCDVDGLEHATWQTQEFYTTDSIYRIPISKIDSVRMVTPDPVLAQGVSLGRDSWLKYVKTYTEQTIIFNDDIPAELIPEVGQVLLAYPNEEPIKEGFSGRVRSVTAAASGIVCSCEEVGISDLYERILVVGKAESENTENQSRGQKRDLAIGTNEKIQLPFQLTGSLEIGDAVNVSASLDYPTIVIDYVLCYGEENLKDMVYFKYNFNSTGIVDVTAKVENDYAPKPKEFIEFPINIRGLRAALSFGTFFKASGSLDVSFNVPFDVKIVDGFKYIEGEGFSGLKEKCLQGSWGNPDWSLSLNGSVQAGVTITLTGAILHTKVAAVDLTAYVGPKVSSSFMMESNEGMNTTLYDALKNVEVTASLGVTLEPGYRVWFKEREDIWGFAIDLDFLKTTRPLLPEITNPKWKARVTSTGVLTADVSKDIFIPVKLGWVLYDDTDNIYDQAYFDGTYWMENEWPIPDMSYTLRNLSGNYNYKAYPVVRLFNLYDIRVPEYAEVKPAECPAKITEFKQTTSEESESGFYYKGKTYKYKFEVATTVECSSDGEDIADWGYVYEDPNGSIARISLRDYYSPYTDTRYVYYRNEPSSTARLYGYVRYAGDSEYVYDEPHDYPLKHSTHSCPDNNHPHMIDLGLPSGTKWACCNAGASKPEGYGGRYVWWQKIADAPSLTQIKELINSCTSVWTTLNGVNGRLFTGPNGGQIFLPAAGGRWAGESNYVGSHGYYWSGTGYGYNEYNYAYGLFFFSGGVNWNDVHDRNNGLSVRPVAR